MKKLVNSPVDVARLQEENMNNSELFMTRNNYLHRIIFECLGRRGLN